MVPIGRSRCWCILARQKAPQPQAFICQPALRGGSSASRCPRSARTLQPEHNIDLPAFEPGLSRKGRARPRIGGHSGPALGFRRTLRFSVAFCRKDDSHQAQAIRIQATQRPPSTSRGAHKPPNQSPRPHPEIRTPAGKTPRPFPSCASAPPSRHLRVGIAASAQL